MGAPSTSTTPHPDPIFPSTVYKTRLLSPSSRRERERELTLPFARSLSFSFDRNINGDLKYTSSIHQLFGGRLRSRVTCSKCGHPSDTFDAFLDLSVEVRQCSSVKGAFDKFVKMDRLEGANKYKCEK